MSRCHYQPLSPSQPCPSRTVESTISSVREGSTAGAAYVSTLMNDPDFRTHMDVYDLMGRAEMECVEAEAERREAIGLTFERPVSRRFSAEIIQLA